MTKDDFTTPLSAQDLTSIAGMLRRWERRLYKNGEYTALSEGIEKIEVHRPEDPGFVIGHFVLQDGWLGFRPNR
jgi:hypothetical protein